MRKIYELLGVKCILFAFITSAWSQNITSIAHNGRLTFSELGDTNFVYTVQWASSWNSTNTVWHSDWSSLTAMFPSMAQSNVVEIPMFFQVVAITNPLVNLVNLPSVAHVNTVIGTENGCYACTHDTDLSTAYGAYLHHGWDGTAECSITSSHTWSSPRYVEAINVKMRVRAYPHGNYEQSSAKFKISLLINGNWTTIYDEGNNDASHDYQVRNISINTGWQGCMGIQVYVYASAYSYEGDRAQEVWADVFEVQASSRAFEVQAGR